MLLEIKVVPRVGKNKSSPRVIVMKCEKCCAIFERPFAKKFLEKDRKHACSLVCAQQLRPWTCNVELSCLLCETKFEKYRGSIKEKNFCSKKCMNEHKRVHSELWPDNSWAMNMPEARENSKQTMKELRESLDYVHPRLGTFHTESSIQLIKDSRQANPLMGAKNGMFGKHHREDSKEAMSDEHTKQIVAGTRKAYGKNNHKRGEYTSVKSDKTYFYRSSWELAVMQHLDENENVSMYDYECVRIPYYNNKNKRWYVPDFLVTFSDNHQEMWEVKPQEFIETIASTLKYEAALKYCNENDIQSYKYMTKLILKDLGILK